jgi:hypothetical protein
MFCGRVFDAGHGAAGVVLAIDVVAPLDGGVAHIRVPDIGEVMRVSVEKGLDIEDTLYQSSLGPIMVLDVIYGYTAQIERSGEGFFAHKTGFTQKSLLKVLLQAGFGKIFRVGAEGQNLEINVLAFKGEPDPAFRTLLGLPEAG